MTTTSHSEIGPAWVRRFIALRRQPFKKNVCHEHHSQNLQPCHPFRRTSLEQAQDTKKKDDAMKTGTMEKDSLHSNSMNCESMHSDIMKKASMKHDDKMAPSDK